MKIARVSLCNKLKLVDYVFLTAHRKQYNVKCK